MGAHSLRESCSGTPINDIVPRNNLTFSAEYGVLTTTLIGGGFSYEIQEKADGLMRDKTVIIVTHRRAALAICDYILHIENADRE